jgi:hypothetical protein
LFISPYYRQLLTSSETDEKTREYIKRKINSAQWLIESIEQRRNTLTRVAQAIVDHQTEFLSKGPEFIEPLKMQQIADKVGVHVTTVSRAVDDKWVQTPRGIFPLKRFFVGGTVSAGGEEVAWDAVRIKLQEIVDHENKHHPHSDDELVKELAKHGLTVARRTVTKYRKAMNIPSSRQRRDWSADEPAAASASAPSVPASSSVSESNGHGPSPHHDPARQDPAQHDSAHHDSNAELDEAPLHHSDATAHNGEHLEGSDAHATIESHRDDGHAERENPAGSVLADERPLAE